MTTRDPITLEHLSARYAGAVQLEAEAHARVMAAHEEATAAEEAHRTASNDTRGARLEFLSYAANGDPQ